MFQSRNRVSFDFCGFYETISVKYLRSFNLVIEFLLISAAHHKVTTEIVNKFQSRNRVSFDFCEVRKLSLPTYKGSFNLVIEFLLISAFRKKAKILIAEHVSIS